MGPNNNSNEPGDDRSSITGGKGLNEPDFENMTVRAERDSDIQCKPEDRYFAIVSRRTAQLARSLIAIGYSNNHFYQKMIGFPTLFKPIYDCQSGIYISRNAMENERDTALRTLKDNPGYLMDLVERGTKVGDRLWKLSHGIKKMDFSRKTDEELKALAKQLFIDQCETCAFILIPLSIQPWLESRLREELKKKVPDDKTVEGYFAELCTPIKKNFHVLEQEEILQISLEHKKTGKLDLQRIKDYIDRYGSINYKYGIGTAWTAEEVAERVKEMDDPEKKLEALRDVHVQGDRRAIQILKELDDDPALADAIKTVRSYVWFRTFRTDAISHSLANALPLFEEIGKRNGLTSTEVIECFPSEILTSTFPSRQTIHQRQGLSILQGRDGKMYYEYGERAAKLIQEVKTISGFKESSAEQTDELRGNIAFKGRVRGTARIVLSNSELRKVNKGDVLIACMTTPDFITAMERASAFVTDEGGILCHAAIISREMKKPCVIGTKNATKSIHEGDLVEVDADSGVVRIIQPSKK
ncbi:MAG: PEP-utilizing enzyme [Nanoarchaeota archaeon]